MMRTIREAAVVERPGDDVPYSISGIQSTACAHRNDCRLWSAPSVTVSGFIASSTVPRGVVLLLVPICEVGDACFLVSPLDLVSCRITVRFMLYRIAWIQCAAPIEQQSPSPVVD